MDVQICQGKSRSRPIRILLMLISLIALLTLSVSADMYVGRYDGHVAWSFDSATGELRVYADCGTQTPTWSSLSDQIRTVYIAPGVTHLPRDAFRGCKSVKEIILPDTVTTVGAYAFADCHSLISLVLPQNLVYVGEYALAGCTSLSHVTYRGSSDSWEALCLQMSSVAGNEWLAAQTPIYTQRTFRVLVSYVSAETGEVVAPTVEKTLTLGASCTVLSPEVEHHAPSESAVVLRNVNANQSIVVVYSRTHCQVHVNYTDESGNAILPSQQLTVAHGASLVLQAPEVEGYVLPEQSEVVLSAVTKNETSHTFRYTGRTLSLTVHCLDELGRALGEPIVVDGIPYRGDYDIPLPQFEGYTVGTDRIRGSGLTRDTEQTVTYSPVYHAVTLRYVDEQGHTLALADVLTVRHGQGLSHTPKSIAGYEPPTDGSISVASVTAAQELDIVYRPARYLLTVRHETVDGVLLTQSSEYVPYLQAYQCSPLPLTGYVASEQQSEHLSGTMPAAPLTVTVYYREQAPLSGDGPQDALPPGDLPSDKDTLAGAGRLTVYAAAAVGGVILLTLGLVLLRIIRKKRTTAK